MTPLKITFHLDGTGVYYDPAEPPMLDAIVASMRIRHHLSGEPPARDEEPFDVPLPFAKWRIGGEWGWHASALIPTDPSANETLHHWRKRIREHRIEHTDGSPNIQNGPYRSWNTPMPLLLTPALEAYCLCLCKPSRLRKDLQREVRWIGKKRAHGIGRVVRVEVEAIEEDLSLVKDGKAMRYLPNPQGIRRVRMRPPYWNNCARVLSCEIGDEVKISTPRLNPHKIG